MKKLFIIAVILLSANISDIIAQERILTQNYGDYVLITNDRYNAVTVTIWYSGDGDWEVVDRIHIPASYTKSFGYGHGQRYLYGYSISGDEYITKFYSDHIRIY